MSAKKFIIIASVLILASIIGGFFCLIKVWGSSDITNAQWLTKVVATNNSTAASIVSTNFTLDTDQMIAAGILSATATDCAMLLNGVDTAFMPGLPGNPWCVFLPSMTANSTQEIDLYSGNVTGGQLVVFHDGTGLTILDDNVDFEPSGSSFLYIFSGYIDSSVVNYIFKKDSAFSCNITAGGNVTWGIGTYSSNNMTYPISTGDHEIKIYAQWLLTQYRNMRLYIDGSLVISDNTTGITMPDNANSVLIGSSNSPYINYFSAYIGDMIFGGCYIDWEYDTTLHDSTAYDNDASWTPRTTSSDADVSAVVLSQSSLVGLGGPDTEFEGWNMLPNVPSTIAGLYSEGGIAFPWGAEIRTVEDEARLPHGTFLFPFAFGTAILAGVVAFKLSHNESKGIKGSLLIMCIVIESVMIIWYVVGGGVIPGWSLIPFGVFSLVLLIWRNPFSPVSQ